MRCFMICSLVLGFLGTPVLADSPLNTDKLGKKIDSVTLTDLNGKTVALNSIQDPKAVVVVFLSFECPVSNNYAPTLGELHKQYGSKGVSFLAVCPTDEKAEAIRKHVEEFKIPFPVYVDPKLNVVDAFKATTTPEAFVLDHNFVLRYRGRIDNSYAARLKKNNQTTEYDLKNALENLLAGEAVKVPATKPIGCHLDAKGELAKAVTTKWTFYKDVLPVLQENCQQCHRPGEVGPFSLMTYKQAVNWAEDIKEYTQSKRMPPWKPVDGPGYLNERKLTDAQIQLLAEWVDGGTPEGNPKDAPVPRTFTEGWQLGKPDLILTVPDDFQLGASGVDTFRCFVLSTGLTEDKYIIGYEVRPGNPKVVHHTLNYWDRTGKARKLEEETKAKAKPNDNDKGPGYSVAMGLGFTPDLKEFQNPIPPIGNFGGWAPGQMSRFLPEGTGYFLPKGADIVMQVHYHRNGKPEKDRTQIGLHFAKKPIEKPWRTLTVDGLPMLSRIPANKPDHVAKGALWVESECTIHSVLPHMHLLGKTVKVTMTPPDETQKILVDIREWDYNWQETYWFKEPIKLKPGTKLEIEAVFDNSDKNPNNPSNPPKTVWRGEETTNEMLFGFLGATSPDGGRIKLSRIPPSSK